MNQNVKVICFGLTLLGIAAIYFGTVQFNKSQEAKKWPQAKGVVVFSRVNSHYSTGQHATLMFSPDVRYQYSVNGQVYYSKSISFGDYSSSIYSQIKNVVDKYYVNEDISVYYDPANPAQAVLEPGKIGGIFIIFAVGALFLVVGLMGLLGSFRQTN